MHQKVKASTRLDWIATIAARASTSVDIVESVLSKYVIEPQPALPRSRRLCIRSVELNGTKQGTVAADGPLTFSWGSLGPGLWALMSDKNSRGKSSVLRVVQCALRGDYPERIKKDIWKWISRAEVCFDIDEIRFRSLVEKPSGEEGLENARARLSRYQSGVWIELYDGPPGVDLQDQTAAVFMEELGFVKFHAFNAKNARSHSHGWPSIASALFINDPGKAIFGDVITDGLPLRLLQLFMGLPWISTLTAAQAAVKQVESESDRVTKGPDVVSTRLMERLQLVENELSVACSKMATRPDRDGLRLELALQDAESTSLQGELRQARAHADELRGRAGIANVTWVDAKRNLQQLRDEQAAGYVFRRLRPVCCPACEAGIEPRRYQAADAGMCALCGNSEPGDTTDHSPRVEALEGNVRDAGDVVKRFGVEVNAADETVRNLVVRRDAAWAAIVVIRQNLTEEQDVSLENEISGLKARATELREVLAEQPVEKVRTDGADIVVLRAAEHVTKLMFEDLQNDILKDVSEAITELAQTFGVENVAKMELRANGVLSIHQGGSDTTFGKLGAGERLRVRIAAALAVVQVARVRGYGRHPGLLVLDSPGAQEMTSADFAALIASVHRTVRQNEGIQIIVGAAARPELAASVPPNQRIYAQGDAFLF